jgi:amino acid adenylation domain-containing protein
VPIDPQYPAERIAFMLEDARPLAIVTEQCLVRQLPGGSAALICLDRDRSKISIEPPTNPVGLSQPSDLAYVIYTSGSTGKPKGVQITHRALVNFLFSMQSNPGLDAQDVLLAVTTISFDIAGLELYLPLISGARILIAATDDMMDGPALASLIKNHGVTIMQATPATWRLLLESGWAGHSTLKILCGGEAWSTTLADQLLPKCQSLWNMYGPTETTVWSAATRVQTGQKVLLGRPIANTQFYILDEHLQPVPVGVPGELYIGGDGLARGYLNRPDLTLEKFIADPFSLEPAARLYKTGDLCRYQADGNLEYLGRVDQQVKIRGFRIELGEIEEVLASHPNILNVAVTARADADGNKNLAAYVVVRQKPAPTVAELREFLLQKLPDYMVPAVFITLLFLPLTPNGKIDRNALPAPDGNRLDQGVPFAAPKTPTELALARIWCKLLGVDQIGIHENFFAIGGHSLLAVRMVNEIKRQLAPDMPVRILFQHSTIHDLARVLSAQKFTDRKPELIPLQTADSGPEIFLIIDGDSVGLFKLSHFMGKDLQLHASVVPLAESALKASVKKEFSTLPRLEDMAAEHAALIKSHPTNRPVLLVGYCFAGILAFEVAHQLQAAGVKVEAVLMLDTWMTQPKWWWIKGTWLREHLRKLTQQGLVYLWRKAQGVFRQKKADLAARHELARTDDFKALLPMSIVARINQHAEAGYRPKPLASRGFLFLSQDDWMSKAYRPVDDSLGAARLFTGGVEVINVPGNHATVLSEAYLTTLAGYFNQCLEQFKKV